MSSCMNEQKQLRECGEHWGQAHLRGRVFVGLWRNACRSEIVFGGCLLVDGLCLWGVFLFVRLWSVCRCCVGVCGCGICGVFVLLAFVVVCICGCLEGNEGEGGVVREREGKGDRKGEGEVMRDRKGGGRSMREREGNEGREEER
ncbi:hypothetical protein Hamer_G010664 [Homarus americanus]|uniref:Uncharacterized protein n=1 Tax=Homarus americanus TaxID=6706 RepID=A0A8J5JHT8_HOMAM|nr:hypothetical protein Hamer_G010664 [Homarus americanus]